MHGLMMPPCTSQCGPSWADEGLASCAGDVCLQGLVLVNGRSLHGVRWFGCGGLGILGIESANHLEDELFKHDMRRK